MFTFLASITSRTTKKLLRTVHKGATTLPGRVAKTISPNILTTLSKGVKVIIVTGTNGKTTTCKMIASGLEKAGKTYFCNSSGANLLGGIITAFLDNSTIDGKCKKEYAVIECDENAFKKVSLYIEPYIVVVTNVFRDQLDRYGEVSSTLDAIKYSLGNIKKTTLVLNADCSLTSSLARVNSDNNVYYFGINDNLGNEPKNSDAKYCIFCKNKYEYTYHTFAHLGGFYCNKCGYKRENPVAFATSVQKLSSSQITFKISIFGHASNVQLKLASTYNIYNCLASSLALKLCDISENVFLPAVLDCNCAFGRMEKFVCGGKNIFIILVKNPTGLSQVLSFLAEEKDCFSVAFCLNDNAADGRDVSWIWDAEYDSFFDSKTLCNDVYVCGKRAYDMALALKYNSSNELDVRIVENCQYNELLNLAIASKNNFFIVPTYTAMMELRPLFIDKFGGDDFWK